MKKRYYILLFILFLIIMCLSPICGDDWGNYIVGTGGIHAMIGNAIGMYFEWEGRFISRLCINFFTYYKELWNIVNSFVLIATIYLIVKLVNPKNKKTIFLLSILTILLMNIYMFSQTVVWIAGNITYLFVIPLMLYYFYCLFNEKYNIFLIGLNIIIPMFIEHMGVIFVLSNLFFTGLYYFKYRKINKKLIFYSVLSIISLGTMLLSPGSAKRLAMENTTFNELSIFGKIYSNLPNFIYFTFFINTYLIILMSFSNFYLLKNVKNKIIRIIGYLYTILTPIIISIIYLISIFKTTIINQNNLFIIIYFISYILIDLYLIIKTKDIKILFFFLIGLGSNAIMLLSPTWGHRVALGTYIFLTISNLMIIDKNIKEKKIINNLLTIIIIISCVIYLILYISVHRLYIDNLNRINEQIKNDSNTIEIIAYPGFINCNINPMNDYHIKKFKLYYNIPDDKKLVLLNNNWKYFIFYTKED